MACDLRYVPIAHVGLSSEREEGAGITDTRDLRNVVTGRKWKRVCVSDDVVRSLHVSWMRA